MRKILTFDCHVSGWCSFRIPHSINAHLTYPAPPPTTIYGLIANALGLWQDDYSLMPELEIGVRILKRGTMVDTFTRWMKWNPHKGSMTTTVAKQKMIQPAYRVYVAGNLSPLLQIQQALRNPKRLLYLGESDDLVELHDIQLQEFSLTESTLIHNAFRCDPDLLNGSSLFNQASVVRWPIRFVKVKNTHSVEYQLVFLSEEIQLSDPIPCLRLSETGDFIILEGEMSLVAR